MTIAQEILESAYGHSSANDPGKLTDDPEMLSQLNKRFQLYFAVWAVKHRQAAASRTVITLAAGGVGTLPVDAIELVRLETAAGAKIHLVPLEQKDRLSWHLTPAMYRIGGFLYSMGRTGDPVVFDAVTLFLLDAPATISALSTVIDVRFPVRFHSLLALDLAVYLDGKDEGRDAASAKRRQDERDRLLATFFPELAQANASPTESPNVQGEEVR